ncbi:MAG TPA: ECF-type sigma factor [Candidatus Kapabacteria bacterium]|nr:ECF-type sigma factor [Candidatus Kapabacteria bacterium]
MSLKSAIETAIETGAMPSAQVEAHRSDFALTRWTLVLRAKGDSPEARAALSELCDAYYNPVLAFLRKERRNDEEARELAQDFFARILSGSGFAGAERNRGRFRSYLLGALKHFLIEVRQRAHRQKRGGGIVPQSLNATAANEEGETTELQIADHGAVLPDANFDREWALEVMRRALSILEQEFATKSKREHFVVLQPWLMANALNLSQADAARQLSMSEGAFKVAVHRLRKRFGELVRTEIAQTLRDPAQADEELAHLVAALS